MPSLHIERLRRSDDDTEMVKSRVSEFSRGKLEAGRNELGLRTARYESKSCC